jgi:hypothetical protein
MVLGCLQQRKHRRKKGGQICTRAHSSTEQQHWRGAEWHGCVARARGQCGEERDYDNLGADWVRPGRSAPGRGACWMRLQCASLRILGLLGRMGALLEKALVTCN